MHGFDFIQDLAIVMLVAGLVGWLCHRVGLSVVVGYLAAGMVIGPHTPPFSLVSSVQRIETLSQVGLVFLMFSIGMKLSIRKLRRLGGLLVVATVVGAIVMYNLARAVGAGLGWPQAHTTFLAAMLMVSSSAIISKVLHEIGGTHEKAGQMAMGVSVLEDLVAVVMLTILGSLTHVSGPVETSLGDTLGSLGAFIALAGVAGLLAVPWLLRKMSLTADQELMSIVMAGLLFMLAILAQRAGFSLALGAFLLGAIVAETPHRIQVDRSFEGLRDIFSAVFFVAIGMMIDLKEAAHLWWLVLLLGVVALAGRTIAIGTGMLVTGASTREAVSIGLCVTPLGEFTFIIAQMGIIAGVLPPHFQAVAVGISLMTTLVAPALMRRAPQIGEWVENRQPRWLENWLQHYRGWLERLTQRHQRSVIWQLSRKRVLQITVEVLVVTGLLVFSESIFDTVTEFLPGQQLSPYAPQVVFWVMLTLIVVVPLLAIWRNVAALAMIYAEMSTAGNANAARLKPVVETGIKAVAGLLLFIWLSAVVPVSGMGRWVPVLALALAIGAVLLLRRKLVYWHSVLEVELQERLIQDEAKFTGTTAPWLAQHGEWHLALTECVLPDLAECRGRTLGELGLRAKFGCVVAGVERQGVMIGNPSPDLALYPHDKVLLLGDPKQTAAGKTFLGQVAVAAPASTFDEVRMELVELPAASRLNGSTLAELAPSRRCGVQVAGINRGGLRLLNPGGDERLLAGDDVLVLGSPDQIAAFRAWANES
ncbi:MAG TPA: cation:proton antiporter [Candidatus Didemnitutus sp.]|nr:cation:proton antiporter [Candidatus Didemnitutus sp.]